MTDWPNVPDTEPEIVVLNRVTDAISALRLPPTLNENWAVVGSKEAYTSPLPLTHPKPLQSPRSISP